MGGWPKKNNKKNQPQKKFDHLFESAGPGCTFVLTKELALKLQQFLKNGHFNQLDNYHDWLIYAYARSHSFKWYMDSYPVLSTVSIPIMSLGQMLVLRHLYQECNRVLSVRVLILLFRLMKELNVQDPFIQSLFPDQSNKFIEIGF